jgi:competence ComEA-like helix-hairpin-helix protein
MKKVWVITAMVFFVVTTGFVARAASQFGLESAGVININIATEDQLKMLPLINDQLAKAIIEYRNSNGPFDSVDQLENVRGVTKEKLEELRPWLVIYGDTTFAPDLYNRGSPGPVY